MHRSLSALSVGAFLIAAAGCQTGVKLEMGPYAVNATETSADICWITAPGTAPTTLAMEQGIQVSVNTKAIPKQKEVLHIATVRGLAPGNTYHYMVVFNSGNKIVGDKWAQFQTTPPKGSTEPLRFAVMGDTRSYPKRHHEVSTAIDGEGPLAFVAQSGDLVADGTVWSLWKPQYFDPAANLLRHAVLVPGQGNHEKEGVIFRELFNLPRSYYSVDYGNVHYVTLNSEITGGKAPSPEMLDWLEKDLMASKAQWKIVSYHRPTFDVITHRTTWGQNDLLPVLERCGVDMVMNGHTHNYQRFRPIGEPGKKPIIFVVSAGGGAPNYPVNPGTIIEQEYSGLHYCLFDVQGNRLEMTTKLPSGQILDHLTLIKGEDGMYQKEVMDRAVTTDFARESAFLLTGFYASAPQPPKPGQWFTMYVSRLSFPEGATVEVSSAAPPIPKPGEIPASPWIVEPVTWTGFKARPGVDEDHSHGEKYEPLSFRAFAPVDLTLMQKGFQPGIRVAIKVTFQGKTYAINSAGVFFRTPTWRSWLSQRSPLEATSPVK